LIYKLTKINKKMTWFYLAIFEHSKNNYSIHGLWPQTDRTHWPSFCQRIPFDLEKLTPILEELHEKWYSDRGKDSSFWEHEYEKHGTCSGLDEYTYFDTALQLFKKALASPEQWLIPTFKDNTTFKIPVIHCNGGLVLSKDIPNNQ